ncbi:hypothetical protein EXIGLDRAFT_707331 [Exidia glandulosa HHB12029]|uniref:Uncharacterized protein n=1 Tax=Exidia glandulosa HHB12029 TaxID=1314781 RepID=A0A166NL17_EXIGL|nr:hypothetical protein EXIGLDRAFT_707331 [Exidia glandulosa HHB12029]
MAVYFPVLHAGWPQGLQQLLILAVRDVEHYSHSVQVNAGVSEHQRNHTLCYETKAVIIQKSLCPVCVACCEHSAVQGLSRNIQLQIARVSLLRLNIVPAHGKGSSTHTVATRDILYYYPSSSALECRCHRLLSPLGSSTVPAIRIEQCLLQALGERWDSCFPELSLFNEVSLVFFVVHTVHVPWQIQWTKGHGSLLFPSHCVHPFHVIRCRDECQHQRNHPLHPVLGELTSPLYRQDAEARSADAHDNLPALGPVRGRLGMNVNINQIILSIQRSENLLAPFRRLSSRTRALGGRRPQGLPKKKAHFTSWWSRSSRRVAMSVGINKIILSTQHSEDWIPLHSRGAEVLLCGCQTIVFAR